MLFFFKYKKYIICNKKKISITWSLTSSLWTSEDFQRASDEGPKQMFCFCFATATTHVCAALRLRLHFYYFFWAFSSRHKKSLTATGWRNQSCLKTAVELDLSVWAADWISVLCHFFSPAGTADFKVSKRHPWDLAGNMQMSLFWGSLSLWCRIKTC